MANGFEACNDERVIFWVGEASHERFHALPLAGCGERLRAAKTQSRKRTAKGAKSAKRLPDEAFRRTARSVNWIYRIRDLRLSHSKSQLGFPFAFLALLAVQTNASLIESLSSRPPSKPSGACSC